MSSIGSISVARCVAWGIILLYMPFVLYRWLMSAAIVSQLFTASLSLGYIVMLLSVTLLAIGSITLLWHERAGSRLVITAILLAALRSPLIYSLFALGNPQSTLSTFLPGSLSYLSGTVPLIPVIILYFCRRKERKAQNQAISLP